MSAFRRFSQNRLDLCVAGSLCAGMEKHDEPEVGKLFADLTCLFEDGAGIAVEGQNRKASLAELRGFAASLSRLTNEATAKLGEIKKTLGSADK